MTARQRLEQLVKDCLDLVEASKETTSQAKRDKLTADAQAFKTMLDALPEDEFVELCLHNSDISNMLDGVYAEINITRKALGIAQVPIEPPSEE